MAFVWILQKKNIFAISPIPKLSYSTLSIWETLQNKIHVIELMFVWDQRRQNQSKWYSQQYILYHLVYHQFLKNNWRIYRHYLLMHHQRCNLYRSYHRQAWYKMDRNLYKCLVLLQSLFLPRNFCRVVMVFLI